MLVGVIALAGSSCGGDGSATPAEPVVGGDLVLVMQPGEGSATNTGRYFVELFDWEGNWGVKEGTANHVGWIEARYGPRHVVTFTAARDNPRGGEPEFCFIVFPGGGGCGLDPTEAAIYGWGEDSAELFAGSTGAEAVITTEAGRTVSILTVEGYAVAEWPGDWGGPESVSYYAADGELLTTLEFQPDLGE